MPTQPLPHFIIYQPNEKEFHICLEAEGRYLRWCSYYAPAMDVRFPREVERIADVAVKKLPKKPVYDEGTYTVTKGDTKDAVEEKLIAGVDGQSFAFVLNGKKLKGRFALKRNGNVTVLQKYKDKYAVEEDVLSGDLARTISTMIPDYDERKVKLATAPKSKRKAARAPEPEPEEEELTADKEIGKVVYHAAFYTSGEGPELCVVTSEGGEVLVLRREGKSWVMMPGVKAAVLRREKEFVAWVGKLKNARQ